MQPFPTNNTISCVICYRPIAITHFGSGMIIEREYVGCINGHLVHRDCLKQWLLQNVTCPVCHVPYDTNIISIFNEYLDQAKKDAQEAELHRQELAERQAEEKRQQALQMDPVVEQKFTLSNELKKQKDFDGALKILWDIVDNNIKSEKSPENLKALMEISVIYIMIEKHALAVKQLMKIVKIDYKYPLGFYYLGICYEQIGLPDKARWAYERGMPMTLELIPANPAYQVCYDYMVERLKKGVC